MPMFQSKKWSKESKRKFENAMMLAKDNPEHIFNFNKCELQTIPQSVFTQCRVLRAESLILHSNALKSISPTKDGGKMSDFSNLKILDLHNNKLKDLPAEIGILKNLRVLNVENNLLTELPASFGELSKLESLLARDNFLNCLPHSVKTLASLRTLDISGTNKVFYLPKTLCYVRTLEALILSQPSQMEYPPGIVAVQGLEEIQKFICKDCGVEYIPPSTALAAVISTESDGPSSPTKVEALLTSTAVEQYQRAKQEKHRQQVELEKRLAEEQRTQALLTAQAREDRAKSQAYIRSESVKFNQTLQEEQARKDKERADMVKILRKVEEQANHLLSQLLQAKANSETQEKLLQELQAERKAQEELFRVSTEKLDQQRKEETLAAMKLILAENDQNSMLINKYLGEQSLVMRRAQESIGTDGERINEELERQENTQRLLVSQIHKEEQLQKEAFGTLLFQRDAVQCRLMEEISQLEKQLTNLTLVEVKKNKLKTDKDKELIQNIRNELTDLLVLLLKEKDEHEEAIKRRLIAMEQQREDDQIDFWLVQYQKLLDTKPQVLVQKEQGLDMQIVKLLRRSDAEQFVPGFARHKITMDNLLTLDDRKLQSIGVFQLGARENILKEIESLIEEQKGVIAPPPVVLPPSPTTSFTPQVVTPTAPPAEEEDDATSMENECVVCMDRQSDCVLLPCGHVCTCHECSRSLLLCPMCRSKIEQKIKIFRS